MISLISNISTLMLESMKSIFETRLIVYVVFCYWIFFKDLMQKLETALDVLN
jgi:hypothetical protein